MKTIYILGFRGTGFRDTQFSQQPALIRAGHVGIRFEGEERIFGFHPTKEASDQIGDDNAVIDWLKEHNTLPANLQDDSAIFVQAHELSQRGARTDVWQITVDVTDQEFERIRTQTLQWYNDETIFAYAFPRQGETAPTDRDNCATFPRRLGIPLPELSGQLVKYISALESTGEKWKPVDKDS